MKLPHTEVKFYPEVKSQTGLSLLRVSCKCALRVFIFIRYVGQQHDKILKGVLNCIFMKSRQFYDKQKQSVLQRQSYFTKCRYIKKGIIICHSVTLNTLNVLERRVLERRVL